jgi:mono/diheme cytochrome c family protein
MTRTIAALLSVPLFAMLSQPAWAAADIEHGQTMAERWCASCHVVAPGQQHGSTQAPPFSEIAKKPGLDAAKLALFLLLPHPRMPDMNLSRNEAADLAAYILTQGK